VKPERAASLRADLALVGIAAIWGFTFPAIQLALRDVGPLSFISLRFGLAAAALAVVFRRRAFRLTRAGLVYSCALGICLSAGTVLQTLGLLHTTASRSAFITALYVVLVPIIGLATIRVRPRSSSLLAVAVACVGLYEITAPQGGGFNPGDLLTVACSFAFGIHIVIAEVAAPRCDVVALTFWQVLVSAVFSSLAMVSTEVPHFALTPWSIGATAVAGLLATALAFCVQMWAQRETSSTHVALIFAAEPVFAALFARLIQQERMGANGLIGGALILAAILLSEVGARPRSRR